MKPKDIVIPYIDKKAASNELLYTVRSICQNFTSPFRLIIIGDLPDWANDKILHIPIDIIEGINFCHALDVNNKLRAIVDSPYVSQNFIYTYDDIVFINKVSYSDILDLKADSLLTDSNYIYENSSGSRKWTRLLAEAFSHFVAKKERIYNYETHLPRVFNKKKLDEVLSDRKFRNKPFLVSTIYFNLFYKKDPVILGETNYKLDISRPMSRKQIEDSIKDHLFLNFNNDGFNDELEGVLKDRFSDPCRLEKSYDESN